VQENQQAEEQQEGAESGGEDVFQFEGLTFKEYIEAGHCPELNWLFAGGTGGA
jgi:hypothetical protein